MVDKWMQFIANPFAAFTGRNERMSRMGLNPTHPEPVQRTVPDTVEPPQDNAREEMTPQELAYYRSFRRAWVI